MYLWFLFIQRCAGKLLGRMYLDYGYIQGTLYNQYTFVYRVLITAM